MNAARLREIVDYLLLEEAKHKIQELLVELSSALGNLAASHLTTYINKSIRKRSTHWKKR